MNITKNLRFSPRVGDGGIIEMVSIFWSRAR